LALPNSSCYQRNLAALRERRRDLAELVDAAVVDDRVAEATGRDGSRTFRLTDETGRVSWFGQSSMPSISAAACIERFLGGGGNVTIPGVLTGCEMKLLLERIGRHVAIFVIEDDPLAIKLALHLHDYAEAIADGRLVFIHEADAADGLARFFHDHPGYEFPRRMLAPPQWTAAQVADMQRLLSNTGAAVVQAQQEALAAVARRLVKREEAAAPERPRVALLGMDTDVATLEQAYGIEQALARMGWPCAQCVPDAPDKWHVVARMRTIEQVKADLVLILNASPAELRPLLPPPIHLASWFSSTTNIGNDLSQEFSENRLALAASTSVREALGRANVPKAYIKPLAPAADASLFEPVELTREELSAMGCEVAVLADLPVATPEASNIHLASHVALWDGLWQVLKRRMTGEGYRGEQAEEALAEAEKRSGVTLRDPSIREHFIELFHLNMLPVMLAQVAARGLADAGHQLGVWGRNWEPLPGGGGVDVRRGPIPRGAALNRLFNAVGVVLLPVPSPEATQMALSALASGTRVLSRAPDQSFEVEYPGLADLAPHLNLYRTADELREAARLLRCDRHETDAPCPGREAIFVNHTLEHRLRALWEMLQAAR
jgi:hypothetical protein